MSITVNGVEISSSAVWAEMQHHPAASREEAGYRAAVALTVRELLLQEARRLAIEPGGPQSGETEEEALIRTLTAREVKVPEPDEATCRRYFASNRNRFRTPDVFEVSHILIAAPPDDEARREAARRTAQAAIGELETDPARLAALAAQLSDCPSKHTGGNLGQITRGQTVPEFEQALLRMAEGALSAAPVESRYGFHVIHLHRRIEGRQMEFGQVHNRIADYLRQRVWRRALAQYLQILAGQADIRGIELPGADSPLVQ
jgi:peptidyl-prolyl cis-trans isomerase C